MSVIRLSDRRFSPTQRHNQWFGYFTGRTPTTVSPSAKGLLTRAMTSPLQRRRDAANLMSKLAAVAPAWKHVNTALARHGGLLRTHQGAPFAKAVYDHSGRMALSLQTDSRATPGAQWKGLLRAGGVVAGWLPGMQPPSTRQLGATMAPDAFSQWWWHQVEAPHVLSTTFYLEVAHQLIHSGVKFSKQPLLDQVDAVDMAYYRTLRSGGLAAMSNEHALLIPPQRRARTIDEVRAQAQQAVAKGITPAVALSIGDVWAEHEQSSEAPPLERTMFDERAETFAKNRGLYTQTEVAPLDEFSRRRAMAATEFLRRTPHAEDDLTPLMRLVDTFAPAFGATIRPHFDRLGSNLNILQQIGGLSAGVLWQMDHLLEDVVTVPPLLQISASVPWGEHALGSSLMYLIGLTPVPQWPALRLANAVTFAKSVYDRSIARAVHIHSGLAEAYHQMAQRGMKVSVNDPTVARRFRFLATHGVETYRARIENLPGHEHDVEEARTAHGYAMEEYTE